jgi:oxygen-dependent protoporphyrinogen oxidase
LPIVPAPIAVVCLGYDASGFDGRVDGFGFLIPRREGVRTLGVLWTSSIFPFEAPPGKVLLRALAGGAHDPAVADLTDDALLETVLGDVATTMGVRARPELVRLFRYREGIPQYAVGHRLRLEALGRRLRELPGLRVTGNSLYGISVNHCAQEAYATAAGVVSAALEVGAAP